MFTEMCRLNWKSMFKQETPDVIEYTSSDKKNGHKFPAEKHETLCY